MTLPGGGGDAELHAKYVFEQQGAEDVAAAQDKITQGWKSQQEQIPLTGAEADKFYQQQYASWDTLGRDFDNFQKTYNAGTQENVRQSDGFTRSLGGGLQQFRAMRYEFMAMQQIGTIFTVIGAAITGTLVKSANDFVKTMGTINSTSLEWMQTQQSIKDSWTEIGGVVAQVMLPGLREAATIMKSVADFAQQHPELVSAALTIGGIMTAIGAITMLVGRIGMIMVELQYLSTVMGGAGGAAGVGGMLGRLSGGAAGGAIGGALSTLGTVTIVATSLIIGAEVGSLIGNAIAQEIYGKDYKQQNIGDALMTAVRLTETPINLFGKLVASIDPQLTNFANSITLAYDKVNNTIGGLIGATGYGGGAAGAGAPSQTLVTQQEAQLVMQYEQQMADATKNYEQQRADTVQQSEQQMAEATQQYEQQRADTVAQFEQQMAQQARDFAEQQARAQRDFTEQQDKALRDYNEQVAKSNRDFQVSQANAARSHQLELQRLEEEHNTRMQDLISARDALGVVKEQQSYVAQVNQSNAQFDLQRSEAAQQHAMQLADMKQNFMQQRADALAAYNQQRQDALDAYNQRVADEQQQEADRLAQMDANHKLEMAKLAQQEQDKLQKLTDAYNKQVDTIQSAFVDRLDALDSTIFASTQNFISFMTQAAADAAKMLQQEQQDIAMLQGSSSLLTLPPGKAYGGYAPYGLYRLGDTPGGGPGGPEYVLNSQTTRLAERIMGGSLTQQNLLAALMGNKGVGGGTMQGNVTVVVQGRSLTVTEVRQEVAQAINMTLGELLPSFGA